MAKKKKPAIGDLPKELAKYEPAVKALQKFLIEQETGLPPGTKCEVYCFGSVKEGIRIAEISYFLKTHGGGMGASYMRSEPECGNIILAAEDFLLTFFNEPYRPKGWDSDIDEHADARWKLKHALVTDVNKT